MLQTPKSQLSSLLSYLDSKSFIITYQELLTIQQDYPLISVIYRHKLDGCDLYTFRSELNISYDVLVKSV